MYVLLTYLIIFLLKINFPRFFSTTFRNKRVQTLSWLVFVPKLCVYMSVCLSVAAHKLKADQRGAVTCSFSFVYELLIKLINP